MISVLAIALVVIASSVVGGLSMRYSRTTSDFLVASRTVSPRLNAAAICGEYLSAGTFLGLAGLVMVVGPDMLWYPVGYTAGYVALLLLVAAPLRRFGSYTIPEFAQGRLDSRPLRRLAAVFVLLISVLYLLPQMKGAGISLRALTGAPYWVGVALVCLVVGGNVAIGGMRGVTAVQAMQYVIKLSALAIAAIVMWAATTGADGASPFSDQPSKTVRETTLTIRRDSVLDIDRALLITAFGVIDGATVDGVRLLSPGKHGIDVGTRISLPAGSPLPQFVDGFVSGESWFLPFQNGPRRSHPVYLGFSVIIATVLGTMGLPHIVTRFYTNPDGRTARRTIVVVIALLGLYYIWPVVLGVLGRRWAPDLLVSGGTDAVVLLLPERVLGPGLSARLLTGLLAGGAFAAFLSTSSGLLVSVAGAVSHDLLKGGVRRFRVAAAVGAALAGALGLGVERFEINVLVGWAFAIAASSFCPLLVLGVWWPKFTAAGAAAGLIIGGGSASVAVALTMANIPDPESWLGALCAQPAAWSVPLGCIASIGGSVLTRRTVPMNAPALLARMHTPEPTQRQ
jgi:Na+(H+)/acetate symporter ActP